MHTNEQLSCRVSVIIPTLNAGEPFAKLLQLLQSQTKKPDELIIIDSCSDDLTTQLAKQAGARVLTVQRLEFDHGGTRNKAAAEATGDLLLFMTQDALPANDRLIEELIKPLQEQQAVYAYARQMADAGADPFEKLAREHNYPAQSAIKSYSDIETMGIKAFFCSNACSAIRRDVFEKMGGFQAPVIFNEDMFMSARCILSGMKTAYAAEAIVYHTHHYTVKQQFKRFFDNGVSMRCNAWILPFAATTKAGSSLIKRQLAGLVKAGKPHLIPRLVLESAAKLLGYKLGMNYNRLPKRLCRRLSMHRLIWNQIESGALQGAAPPAATNYTKAHSVHRD